MVGDASREPSLLAVFFMLQLEAVLAGASKNCIECTRGASPRQASRRRGGVTRDGDNVSQNVEGTDFSRPVSWP